MCMFTFRSSFFSFSLSLVPMPSFPKLFCSWGEKKNFLRNVHSFILYILFCFLLVTFEMPTEKNTNRVIRLKQKWSNICSLWIFKKNFQTRSANMCTKYVHEICARNMCKKYVHEICARNMCTKYVHEISARKMCTKNVHEICPRNMCTKRWNTSRGGANRRTLIAYNIYIYV